MEIKRIKTGNVNCYLMVHGRAAILVDTGRRKHRVKVLEACREYHVTLIVLTHGHVDHAQNAAFLSERLQVPIAMHRADLALLEDKVLTADTFLGKQVLEASLKLFQTEKIPSFSPRFFLEEGDILDAWGVPAKVIELPGHTRGSIGFDTGEHLLVGDALMNMFHHPCATLLFHNEEAMLGSAARIGDMGRRTIWFGHGKQARNRRWVR